MKKACIILFAVITCQAAGQCQSEPYTIEFDIMESHTGLPTLIVDMKLADGSHYVSPHSTGDFSGKFSVYFEEGSELDLRDPFVETPRSYEIYDPHPLVRGNVNLVRVDTHYEYPLQIDAKGDFETIGTVRFTIEPRCTLEQISFVIKRKDGKLTIEKNLC